MSRLTKPRFLLVYLFAAWLFLMADTSESRMRLGVPLVIVGALLRLWANGYVGHVKVNWTQHWRKDPKIGQLATAGPYAYVRHPLYLGSLLIGVGFCIIAGRWWLGVVALGSLLLVYRRKIIEEERLLLHEWGEGYRRYQQAVPRYLPNGRRYPAAQGRWSWQGVLASQELKTLAWVVVLVIGLYFREEMVQEREPLFQKHQLERALLLGLLVVLVSMDGLLELARRRSLKAPGRARTDKPQR